MNKENYTNEIRKLFPRSTGHTASAMCVIPQGFKFETQDVGEKVLLIFRSSLFSHLRWIIGSIFYSILFFVFMNLIINLTLPGYGKLSNSVVFLLGLIYLAFVFTYLLQNILKWYYNLYIVTNQRIVDYDFSIFAGFKISETNIVNIEDISQTGSGFLSNFFNYGTLIIQTAGERLQFQFDNIPQPAYIRNKITDLATIVKKYNNI